MKIGSIVTGLLLSVFVAQAHASRQYVTCVEVAKGGKLKAYLDFDPSVTQETIWQKDPNGTGSSIITYKNGTNNNGNNTTARVGLEIPSSQFKAPYSGRFLFTDFYDVNTVQKAGSGYSDKFDNQAYRLFHGHDKDQRWDMMVYIPDSIIGKDAKDFAGLATIQMDLMDQGYYHVDMTCSSTMRE